MSNLASSVAGAVVDMLGCDEFVDEVGPFGFGCPKKAVMEPLALGFLTASKVVSAAFRLRAMLRSAMRRWWSTNNVRCWMRTRRRHDKRSLLGYMGRHEGCYSSSQQQHHRRHVKK